MAVPRECSTATCLSCSLQFARHLRASRARSLPKYPLPRSPAPAYCWSANVNATQRTPARQTSQQTATVDLIPAACCAVTPPTALPIIHQVRQRLSTTSPVICNGGPARGKMAAARGLQSVRRPPGQPADDNDVLRVTSRRHVGVHASAVPQQQHQQQTHSHRRHSDTRRLKRKAQLKRKLTALALLQEMTAILAYFDRSPFLRRPLE